MGPLFACIIKRQFENLKAGDRFFFSHSKSQRGQVSPGRPHPQGLSSVAKKNIHGRSLGAILCENLDPSILRSKMTGRDVFRIVSRTNPALDCRRLKNGKLDISGIFWEALSEDPQLGKGLPNIAKPEPEVVSEVSDFCSFSPLLCDLSQQL